MESQYLSKKFDLPSSYYDKVLFDDGNIGFSVKKRFDQFKGISIVHVYMLKEDFERSNPKKRLYIRFTYGTLDKDSGGVKLDYNTRFFQIDKPVQLFSKDEYYYDVEREVFIDKYDNAVSSRKILEDLERLHVKPTQLSGFFFRVKLFTFSIAIPKVIETVAQFLIAISWIISGRYIRIDFIPSIVSSKAHLNLSHTSKRNDDRIDFFGYRGTVWGVSFFGLFHLAGFCVFYLIDFTPQILSILFTNNFLSVIYAITGLVFVEKVLPRVIESIILLCDQAYKWSLFHEISV